MRKVMRMILLALTFTVVLVALTGCRKYNRPAVVQIEPNESAFLVDMRSDNAVTTDQMTLIQKKDVIIEGYWVKTGYMWWSGHYRPTQRVLVVSRRPVEQRWDGEDGNPIIRVASRESVGFAVPLVINATIINDEDALTYLTWFRTSQDVDRSNKPMENVREEAEPLENAINRVIMPIIANALSEMFLDKPIIEAEPNRVAFVREAFERAQEEAKVYGITLLTLASTDGLLYDDPNFQAKINELAGEKMREAVLIQQELNAKAEQDLAKTQAETTALVAETLASTLEIQLRQAEIEGVQRLYEAQAQAIIRRASLAWPTTLIVQDLLSLEQLGLLIPDINITTAPTMQPVLQRPPTQTQADGE
jgi:hypothetical protein